MVNVPKKLEYNIIHHILVSSDYASPYTSYELKAVAKAFIWGEYCSRVG